ncbi:hypothetical protein EXIGLDRAFT_765844 [Exidia glandulosa HHB12029]|uniref:F-box domain-containing protein n=1 Tax=Exidia glandulosa HHB12029 TaxID=1314781 RepID=A0A165K772_EXIGL|nr:hypothetical protein EXIGLDRAFT_765844 [Exidia glandulosa HHB12029]
MLVSRRWRDTALDHPTYWKEIELDTWGVRTGPRLLGKVNFFLLRLSRSKGRLLELSLEIVDTDFVDEVGDTFQALLDALNAHLHHLSYLSIDAHIRYLDAFLRAVTVPAPMLRSLALSVSIRLRDNNGRMDYPTSNPPLPVLDTDIFCSVAPLLREVTLSNILPPFDLPCFADVEWARIGYSAPEKVILLETDVFNAFPRLRSLTLYGQMSLEPSTHPVSVGESGWQALESLEVFGRLHPQYRHSPGFDRIPTESIRTVDVDVVRPLEVRPFIDDLPGQLELSIAGLADHVAGLNALKPDDYDPEDENFGPEVWTLAIQSFSLQCPVLTLLELWFSAKGCRLRCPTVDVLVFVQTTLPQSTGPLTLRLYNIDLIGDENALKPRIARVEHM